jgi:hypothetical protein
VRPSPCSPFALLALCGAPFALCGEQTTTEQGAPFAPFAHNLSLLKVNLSSQSEFEKSRFEFSK